MDEKTFFNFIKNGINRKKINNDNTYLIIDEYDEIFFDDNDPIKLVNKFKQITMSGSFLNEEEENCIFTAFNKQIIKFPSLKELYQTQNTKYPDIIVGYDNEWHQKIYDKVQEFRTKVPVILAFDYCRVKMLKQFIQSNQLCVFDLCELQKNGKYAELQTIIECQFNKKQMDGNYGLFLINQELGRGADFPTHQDIEREGGIFLIIGELFNERTQEQVKGRISRMQSKGQYQNILINTELCPHNDFIHIKSNIINLKYQTKLEALILLLQQQEHSQPQKQNIPKILCFKEKFFDYNQECNQRKQFDNEEEKDLVHFYTKINNIEVDSSQISEDEYIPTKHIKPLTNFNIQELNKKKNFLKRNVLKKRATAGLQELEIEVNKNMLEQENSKISKINIKEPNQEQNSAEFIMKD